MKATTQNLTGMQLRAARALLHWRVQDLAKKTRVNIGAIRRAELLDGAVNLADDEKDVIIRVLARAGVTLFDSDEFGSGAFCKRGENVTRV